jgi:DNA primase
MDMMPPVGDEYPPMPDYDFGGEVPPPPKDYVPYEQAPVEAANVMDDPLLAPCEKEILGFILEYGTTTLDFDRDSKYYIEGESINVAEFIDGILAEDEAEFVNAPYRIVYEEYFRMYDEGLTQEQIQKRLLNSMDETVAHVAKDLLIEKHQITVKNYEDSLTSVSTRLVQFVPRSLLAYQIKKVEKILKSLTAELATTTDESHQVEILTRISEYNKARTRLNNELGRV